jgi:carbohydrate-selective porin OprB
MPHRFVKLLAAVVMAIAPCAVGRAQTASAAEPIAATTVLDHPDDTRWWASGQINLVTQFHRAFSSPYMGEHSFRPAAEHATSLLWTVFTGVALTSHAELLLDIEGAGGRGLSDAFGLAGFTDLDVVRNPTLGSAPYLARLQLHYTIPLSQQRARVTRGPLSLATSQSTRRIEIRVGKMSMADTFDLNAVGSDSHLQFLNWTVDNNGAYDYAADTRGYTYGVVVEYDAPRWSIRGAEALMPKVANGIELDWNLGRARGESVELEFRPNNRSIARLLGYVNHANMGSYDEAIQAHADGLDPLPDIEAHRQQGRRKAGVAANVESALPNGFRVFARAGWNDGENESFAYTEADTTLELGGDVRGSHWRRDLDRLGVAAVFNGLSDVHREYLRQGGLGFLLGDGTLQYGRESILESYYTAHIWRGVFAAADVQHIVRPGYNNDRGPATVGTVRLHVDF